MLGSFVYIISYIFISLAFGSSIFGMDDSVKVFCDWLLENGASFPKISWPAVINEDGVRGAIAIDTIEVSLYLF